jgi:hypothetical protein
MDTSRENLFGRIFHTNAWGGAVSVSGRGASLRQTVMIIAALPRLFKAHQVCTVLDIPCGDFHWMRHVDLQGINYLGADIVAEIIRQNRQFGAENIDFAHLDLLSDPLPTVDLVLCRDCLGHFTFAEIFQALNNIRRSVSKLLLTTTFPLLANNYDITTGKWRPLNLQRPPFVLPEPVLLLEEGCTEGGGKYADKSLGLWRISDLKAQPSG